MGRSFEAALSDAKDVARRTTLQLALIGGGLAIIAGGSFREAYRSVSLDRRSLAETEVRKEKTSHSLDRVRANLDIAQKRVQTLRETQKSACKAGADNPNPCRAAEIGVAAAAHRVEKLDRQAGAVRSTQARQAEDIRKISTKLNEIVPFDIGNGWKLPFTLTFAPFAWLLILAILLWWLGTRRALFWSLIFEAQQASPVATSRPRSMIDTPFWLAPVPTRGHMADVRLAAQFVRIVGWARTAVRKRRQLRLALLAAAGLVLMVGWIGEFFVHISILDRDLGGRDSLPTATALAMRWSIGILTTIDLLLLLWLAAAHRLSLRQARAVHPRLDRRALLIAGGASAGIGVLFSLAPGAALNAGWQKLIRDIRASTTRQRKRTRRVSKLAGLKPGWYRHRSGKWYEVDDKALVHGQAGLKAKNLKPADLDGLADQIGEFNARRVPRAAVQDAVHGLLGRNRVADAKVLALNWLRYVVSFPDGRADPRDFDLAAGLAARYDDPAMLARVVDLALIFHHGGISGANDGTGRPAPAAKLSPAFLDAKADPRVATIMDARLRKWTGASGADWRARQIARQRARDARRANPFDKSTLHSPDGMA